MKPSPASDLFPISLSGIATKSVVDRYAKNLSRTMPSKIEIDCTKAGINKVLDLANQRRDKLLMDAAMKRRLGEIDIAELKEYAAQELGDLIGEVRAII